MAKKRLTEEEKREIDLLKNSYKMLEQTKKESEQRGKKESVKRIQIAQDEVLGHIKSINPDAEDDVVPENVEQNTLAKTDLPVEDAIKREEAHRTEQASKNIFRSANSDIVESMVNSRKTVVPDETMYNDTDSTTQYDVIPLPSNGEGYPGKVSRLPVAYLTAYDENLITSPNLYRDGLVIDFLLKNKVVNKSFNVEDLLSGDADAIIWFLRTTSYGPEFPITARDPETGQEIETVVDLSQIKTKEFTLKGDENGHFSYTLPITKAEIKFKFLTRKEEKSLQLLQKMETEGVKAEMIREICGNIDSFLNADETLSKTEADEIRGMNGKLMAWSDKLKKVSDKPYLKIITNRLEMQVQAVNGDYDKETVRKFIMNMPAKDSLMLRRYILENEPGLDFEVEIQRPESLGGGSFKTFLDWDDSVFLNIA